MVLSSELLTKSFDIAKSLSMYPLYSVYIALYTFFFIPAAVTFGRLLHRLFPRYTDDIVEKNQVIIYTEVVGQVILTAILSYFFRETVDFFLLSVLKVRMLGEPSTFASLVIAPIMFGSQPDLIKKIKYLWNIDNAKTKAKEIYKKKEKEKE